MGGQGGQTTNYTTRGSKGFDGEDWGIGCEPRMSSALVKYGGKFINAGNTVEEFFDKVKMVAGEYASRLPVASGILAPSLS